MKTLTLTIFVFVLSTLANTVAYAGVIDKNPDMTVGFTKTFYVKYNKDIRISAILDVCGEQNLAEKYRVNWNQELERIKDSRLHEDERYLKLEGREKIEEWEIMGAANAAANLMFYFSNGFREGVAYYKTVNPEDFKQSCGATVKFVKENPKQDLIIVK